jgi:hypothetical protein
VQELHKSSACKRCPAQKAQLSAVLNAVHPCRVQFLHNIKSRETAGKIPQRKDRRTLKDKNTFRELAFDPTIGERYGAASHARMAALKARIAAVVEAARAVRTSPPGRPATSPVLKPPA